MSHYSQSLHNIFLSPLLDASPLGSMIQDIKGKFLWCVKFQHVTFSIWISPSCSNVGVLIPWINFKTNELAVDLKCVGCISVGKKWNNLWLGVSNQQHDWAIVISVGIYDNFQRMSISSHIGVRWLYLEEEEHPPSLLMSFERYKMYGIICAYDKDYVTI